MTDQSARLAASVSHISLMHRPYGPRIHLNEDASGSPGGEAIPSVPLPADAPESFNSPRDAAAYYAGLFEKPEKQPAESAETATAEPELAKANDGPETVPVEEPEGGDPEAEKLPSIERPRSWSKDDDDDWNALPRERQEKIATNERAREADINRRINEAAEKLKGLTAKEQQVEEVRQQFEAKIKTASEVLEREQLRDFPDIKTMADVERMAAEDPFRKIQWDVHQQKMQAVAWELQQAEGRKAQQHQADWNTHVQTENAKAAELIPELADKVKGPAFYKRAIERLSELGFKPDEVNDLATGKTKLSIHDHRLQQLLASDFKLTDIQKAKTAVAAKPLPPVQRPGSSKPAGNVDSERIQALNRKPELTIKEATELDALQQSSRRRAS